MNSQYHINIMMLALILLWCVAFGQWIDLEKLQLGIGMIKNNASLVSPECYGSIMKIITNPLSKIGQNFFLYSGRRVMDTGNYWDCKKTKESYLLLSTWRDFSIQKIGLCVPNDCGARELNNLAPILIPIFNSKGLNPEAEMHSADTELSHGLHLKRVHWVYIVGILLGSMTVISLIATYLDWNGKAKGCIQSFSLAKNCSFIFTLPKASHPLDVFNGLRVIGVYWVAISHYCGTAFHSNAKNDQELYFQITQESRYFYAIPGALAVDISFLLSGFFAFFSLSSIFKDPRKRTILSVLISYIYRFLRLFPMMLVGYLIFTFVLPIFRNDLTNPQIEKEYLSCRENPLGYFFYYSNFIKTPNCMCWSWYLNFDSCYFLIAPLFVILIYKSQKYGIATLLTTFLASITYGTYFHYSNNVSSSYHTGNNYQAFYESLISRSSPYLFGIFLGWVYINSNSEKKCPVMEKIRSLILDGGVWKKYLLYAVSFFIIAFYLVISVINNNVKFPQILSTVFNVSEHIVWPIGWIMLCYPSIMGKKDIITKILGHPLFSPFAKVSYGVFMFHHQIIYLLFSYTSNPAYTDYPVLVFHLIILIGASVICSIFITSIVESPCIGILKAIFEGQRKTIQKPEDTKAS